MDVKVAALVAVSFLALLVGGVVDNRPLNFPWDPNERHTYSVDLLAMKVYEDVSNEYFKWGFLRFGRYNSTPWFMVFNGMFTVVKELPKTAWITLIGHEKMASNKYSAIPVKFIKRNLCDFVEKDFVIYYDLLKYSNLTNSCPIEKGDYYIKDYHINEYYLPPELPGSEWRLYWTIQDKASRGKVIFRVSIDFQLRPPTSNSLQP